MTDEQVNKKIDQIRSTKRKEQLRRANMKWRNSDKGRAYLEKQKQLEKLARDAIRQEKAEQAIIIEPAEEQLSPQDKEFLEWCRLEYEEQKFYWKEETKEKKQQHTRDYFMMKNNLYQ